jgi:hypothetical protein
MEQRQSKRVIGRPFAKRTSGNPGGRPRREVIELARQHSPQSTSDAGWLRRTHCLIGPSAGHINRLGLKARCASNRLCALSARTTEQHERDNPHASTADSPSACAATPAGACASPQMSWKCAAPLRQGRSSDARRS